MPGGVVPAQGQQFGRGPLGELAAAFGGHDGVVASHHQQGAAGQQMGLPQGLAAALVHEAGQPPRHPAPHQGVRAVGFHDRPVMGDPGGGQSVWHPQIRRVQGHPGQAAAHPQWHIDNKWR
ncbi:hypothetical protein D3C85_1582400 [compost metagenome]